FTVTPLQLLSLVFKMTSLNSSLAYWTKKEIYPNSIFLTTSGSGGDRLLFWQPSPHVRESETRTKCKLLLNGTRPTDGCQSESYLPIDTGLTVESNRNPFALNLITDRSAATGETSGLSTASYTTLDRLTGSCVAGGSCNVTSNHCGSGSPATASVSGTPSAVVACGPMVGGSGEAVEASPSSVSETNLDGGAVMGVNGLSTIEGLPTKLLLSLLHQQFQGLQRKIYIKVNLITDRSAATGETSGLSTASYTTLDRLTGSCVAGGSCNVTSNHCGSGSPATASVSGTPSAVVACGPMVGGSGEAVEASPSSVSETNLDGGAVMGVNGLSTIEGLPTKLLLSLLHQQFQGLQRKIYIKLTPISDFSPPLLLSNQIDQVYPVFFCLPHKAYCLTRESIMSHTPAIRPMAIWRAMDKIRPYHALMLVHRKQHLIDRYLPKNANTNMIDFINDLSPTVSLHDLSTRIQSQSYTLSLALWLIYRGHAMIVYPVVATNMYVLSPQFAVWFNPQMIIQFASRFPSLNLAQALASFSIGLSLKEYSSTTPARNQNDGANHRHKPTTRVLSSTDSTPADPDSFWMQLSYATKVELITWLLRRRLIIQIHVYVFSTMNRESFLRAKQSKPSEQSFVTPGAQQSYITDSYDLPENKPAGPPLTVEDIRRASRVSDSVCTRPSDTIQATLSLGDRGQTDNRLADLRHSHQDLIGELRKQFPEDLQQTAVDVILNHPGATQNITLFSLFVRILPHLPAHLEELMFTLAVSRFMLIECIERFSPWLSTARLPDPVTACFSGIDWPD
ncbi:nitrogen permease regulator 3-like protein, partial [Paragonimus westermani]